MERALIAMALLELDGSLDASEFHDSAQRALQEGLGLRVQREWPLPYRGARGRRSGRIDLVVLDSQDRPAFGIELDRRSPRARSLEKLRRLGVPGLVVMRQAARTGRVEAVFV